MSKAVKSLAEPGAPWVEVDVVGFVNCGGREFDHGWLSGLSDEDLAAEGLTRAEIVETSPPLGLKNLQSAVADIDGVPTRTYSGEALTGEEVTALRAAKVAAVKAEAERRILAIMPDWQQRNLTALGLELVTTHGADPANWPPEDVATHTAALGAWAAIKAVRVASNTVEAAVPNDAEAIDGFDVAAQAAWPVSA